MVSAIRSDRGASRRLLEGAIERRFTMLVSTPLLIEYEAVMTRAEHLDVAGLSALEVSRLLDAVAAVGTPVELAFHWRPRLRDADDDMVLETAINGGAEAIVTLNARDFSGPTEMFGVEVLAPRVALARVEAVR
jgi:putative PIN family toxin of toxin-antitoxin system